MADAVPPSADDRPPQKAPSGNVGSAYMRPDGTLEMSLSTETATTARSAKPSW